VAVSLAFLPSRGQSWICGPFLTFSCCCPFMVLHAFNCSVTSFLIPSALPLFLSSEYSLSCCPDFSHSESHIVSYHTISLWKLFPVLITIFSYFKRNMYSSLEEASENYVFSLLICHPWAQWGRWGMTGISFCLMLWFGSKISPKGHVRKACLLTYATIRRWQNL
jgi:hypothetical protein